MDFTWSAEQDAYRMQVRNWLEENRPRSLGPRGEDPDASGDEENWQRLKTWHKKLYAAGWAGLTWPKEYGGRGATFIEQLIFNQELGRLNLPMGCNVLGVIMSGPALMQWGTDEQKKRYLQPILAGDEIWCEGMSEPGAGSDLASIQCRAELKGDEFIVNGQKVWTTTAHRSHFCQLFVRTDPEAPKHKGMSALIVDMHSPGVTVRPLKQITGESEFNEIFFEDARVPKENLLGPINMGWQVLVATLMHERFGIGETLGGTEQVLQQLVQIARAAQVNGRPAIEDKDIRQQIAQFAIETTAKKYNGLRSLSKRLKGQQPGPEASISKLLSTDLGQRMTKFVTRLLGGYAMLERRSPFAPDGDWMRRILASESMTIAGGTSPVQKNMIGERILQLPKG
ncbi:MAG: acyl-CoA dehydrogenase family protein [Candidatus Binatus sp.]|uniref:acyl-CoA dehydrogenase family protein n=1 Tax=Candidatus Binatus sp. TaxID=2811406 RepID=UPI0027174B47|nr:acyl-CoA dehydrogenase family protein [Candidatus Binatus sp.]MDO8432524.1 acyl-CoA dehydrogenase family protein [Candidatus Binatus sp.]